MLELHEVADDDRPDWRWRLTARQSMLRFGHEYDEPAAAAQAATRAVDRMLPESRIFTVTDTATAVGFVWWGADRGDIAVYDAQLDEPARVTELLPLLLGLAREAGAQRIAVGGLPGDPTLTALAALPGFETRATNMLLPLDRPVADPEPVQLCAMTGAEFDRFSSQMITGYAAELAASGMSEAAALHTATNQCVELIPDGLASPKAEFFTGWVDGEPVGRLWLGTERPMAFVYELEVEESQRRKGYGAAIMNAGARWCQERGIFALGLNVFGPNLGARGLYDKLGYDVTIDHRTIDVPDAG